MTSPRSELWVEPGYLRDLAHIQNRVGEAIASAAELCAEEAAAVTRTHGLICLSTAVAAEAPAAARANACAVLQTTSESYAANLETAAAKYGRTDQNSGNTIDGKMRPGRR